MKLYQITRCHLHPPIVKERFALFMGLTAVIPAAVLSQNAEILFA